MKSVSEQATVERRLCEAYLAASRDERPLADVLPQYSQSATVIVAEGFEVRSLGVLELCAQVGVNVSKVIVGRYETSGNLNEQYRPRFEQLADLIANHNWCVLPNYNDGEWLAAALSDSTETVLLDITGVSHRALFRTLDIAANSGKNLAVAYTEALQYWPKDSDWKQLRGQLRTHESLAELVDTQPWLFSYEHAVEIVPGHEGYDASGAGRALLAFLPYKCARLAAVLAREDYADMVFVAGRPPASELAWRVDALKEINESLTKGWPVEEMSTFGYRNTLRDLTKLLLCDDSLLWKYDLHFAPLGSKLQSVACWVFSCLMPSITMITSVPSRYYREAYSDGVGRSWVFPLTPPLLVTTTRDEE